MFWKAALVIVSLGACGCTLLALRQSRLQAAHELAEAQLRIRHHDEQLWRLRSEIAARVTPASVQLMAEDLGPMHPLLPPPPGLVLPPGWLPANPVPTSEPPKKQPPKPEPKPEPDSRDGTPIEKFPPKKPPGRAKQGAGEERLARRSGEN